MKNAIKILSLLTLVFFAACKKDDDKNADSGINGTWNLTALTCNDCTSTTEFQGTTSETTFTTVGKNFTSKVTFKADGTYTASGAYTAVQEITYNGSTFTQETEISDFLGSGTYEVNGDQLTTHASTGETGTGTILSNTNGVMELKFVINQEIPGNATTPSVTTTGTYYYTLEKV